MREGGEGTRRKEEERWKGRHFKELLKFSSRHVLMYIKTLCCE